MQDVFYQNENVSIISIHEKNRWPKTGTFEENKIFNLINFPVNENFNDNEMDYVVSNVIVPFLKAKKIDILIIQAGADMLDGDPQSRIRLTNNAYWKAVRDVQSLSENVIILGGGGYNPYLTAKAWAGNWVLINDKEEVFRSRNEPTVL